MPGKQNKLWIWTTVFLSIVFALLFYPIMTQIYPFGEAITYTVGGVVVIWVAFFIRINIFNRITPDK